MRSRRDVGGGIVGVEDQPGHFCLVVGAMVESPWWRGRTITLGLGYFWGLFPGLKPPLDQLRHLCVWRLIVDCVGSVF